MLFTIWCVNIYNDKLAKIMLTEYSQWENSRYNTGYENSNLCMKKSLDGSIIDGIENLKRKNSK